MIKNNKLKCIISSIVILIPAFISLILWKHLPEQMAIHFGPTGKADGYGSRAFLLILPFVLLALHWICLFITAADPKSKGMNKKVTGLIFFIMPTLSLFIFGFMLFIALGHSFNVAMTMPIFLGILFAVIGNIMPKAKQNHTFGIKIPTTLSSADNWTKTHRLAGKVWFFGGIAMLLAVFIPVEAMMITVLVITLVITFIPVIYSLAIAKKEKDNGEQPEKTAKTPIQKAVIVISAVMSIAAVIFAMVLSFTGNVSAVAEENGIRINSTYYSEHFIEYEDVEKIELVEDFDFGSRQMGFGSPVMLLGSFRNDELGNYTLYAYARQDTCIVITLRTGKTVAVSLKSAEKTVALYDSIRQGGNLQ
jgi:uncharacterized membrane protein